MTRHIFTMVRVLSFVACIVGLHSAIGQNLIQITSPTPGTTEYLGQTFPVQFTADPSVTVLYAGAGFVGSQTGTLSSENTFSINVPLDTQIDQYQLFVLGTVDGHLVFSDPVPIVIDTPQQIVSVRTDPVSLLFSSSGYAAPLLVIGTLSDGSTAYVTHSPKISLSSTNTNVATVDDWGRVTGINPGTGFITITGANAAYSVYTRVAPQPVALPVITPKSGFYTTPQHVSITDKNANATIYFTTNGSLPTAKSLVYTGPIDVTTDETINAVAIAPKLPNSVVASAAYSIKVQPASDQVTVSVSPESVPYTGHTLATVALSPGLKAPTVAPSGTVKLILDGTTLIKELTLQGSGHGTSRASYDFGGIAAGKHTIAAAYSGDSNNPASVSASVPYVVTPDVVTLTVSCVNPAIITGTPYLCRVYTAPIKAGSPGTITYVFDGGDPVEVTLERGAGEFTLPDPALGKHSVVISYAAQGNYSAAIPVTKTFTVVPK